MVFVSYVAGARRATMFSTDQLKVSTADGHNFTLLEPFTYLCKDGTIIIVPEGSQSDGASTPQILWNTLPPFGVYFKAAFLHDFLYRATEFPKEFCDNVLLEAMECLGVNQIEADTIYEGVHLGGWMAFNEDRKGE